MTESWILELRQVWENQQKKCNTCDTYHLLTEDQLVSLDEGVIFTCATCKVHIQWLEGIVAQCFEMICPIAVLCGWIWIYVEFVGKAAQSRGLLRFSYALYYNEAEDDLVYEKVVGGMINGAFVLIATIALTIVFLVAILSRVPNAIRICVRILFAGIIASSIIYFGL